MPVNSSSSSSDSLLYPNLSSINYYIHPYLHCYISRPSSFVFTTYILTNILLLLPLCIFIIYHGLQQWRQQRSTSSAATMSHSDSFTYHMVTMELIGVFGFVFWFSGSNTHHLNIAELGFYFFCFTWYGERFFHVLTCVERYLAVVHPITYLSLRKERGIRIRNISISCVWLLCIAGTSLLLLVNEFTIVEFCLVILSLAVVSFCSVSVLRVLIRPGPGEQGGRRESVDQSKQRAFYTIMAILGVLVLRFSWSLVDAALSLLEGETNCVVDMFENWMNLPSALVLPLLFLHRAGKLVCWKKNIQ